MRNVNAITTFGKKWRLFLRARLSDEIVVASSTIMMPSFITKDVIPENLYPSAATNRARIKAMYRRRRDTRLAYKLVKSDIVYSRLHICL